MKKTDPHKFLVHIKNTRSTSRWFPAEAAAKISPSFTPSRGVLSKKTKQNTSHTGKEPLNGNIVSVLWAFGSLT